MRIRSVILLCGLAGSLALGQTKARAAVEFSAGLEIHSPSEFYEPLGSYGAWINVGSYGRCWHPAHIEADWRPYCNGHWEWTDCGWYWVSDEPWSWACYHYGSWTDDPTYGWIWIPGTEWAPAWVVWRDSPDYIGWAPCGPGLSVLPASQFVFVDVHHFHDRLRPRDVIVNNTRIIERTRVIKDFRHETRDFDGTRRQVVLNQGPGIEAIQRATGAKLTARPVREVVRETPLPENLRRQPKEEGRTERERGNVEVPRDRTGREQPRVNQPPPTDREQPRQNEQRPVPQERQRRPEAVPQRTPETTLPPTGREVPRMPQTTPQPLPQPPAERVPPRAVPERPVPPPATQPERPLPPTGRERGFERNTPPAEVIPPRAQPPARELPQRPAEPTPRPEQNRDRDKQG